MWTTEETTQFQIDNQKVLDEVNSTLVKPSGRSKIGIFLPGQVGDLATATSVLRYKNVLWPDKDIIWFVNMPNAILLKHSLVNEVRPWPWAGNGLQQGTPDFYPLLCTENNRLNQELKKNYELTEDLEEGYFPAPYMVIPSKRHGLDYPNVSRKVFGINPKWDWHPCLEFSWEDRRRSGRFMDIHARVIMIENFCGSGQSRYWDDKLTWKIMDECKRVWGSCFFLFASHVNNDRFLGEDAATLSHENIREVALTINYCDLFIGMSSGISVVTSYWGSKPVPKIQLCGSFTCSTVTLATGPIDLVTTDDITEKNLSQEESLNQAQSRFMNKLTEVLNKYK